MPTTYIETTFADINSVEKNEANEYFNNFTYEKIRPQIVAALEAAHAALLTSPEQQNVTVVVRGGPSAATPTLADWAKSHAR